MVDSYTYNNDTKTVEEFSKQMLLKSEESGESFHGGILINDTVIHNSTNHMTIYALSNQSADFNLNLINALTLEGIL